MKTKENRTVTPEKILVALYLGLIAASLASLIWAILSGEISMNLLKYW